MTTVSISIDTGTIDKAVLLKALEEATVALKDANVRPDSQVEITVFDREYSINVGITVDDKEWTYAPEISCC